MIFIFVRKDEEIKALNPLTPVAQKVLDEVVFDVSKVKKSSVFFKSDLTDPPQIFDAHLLKNTHSSPSSFYFFSEFLYQDLFSVRWF